MSTIARTPVRGLPMQRNSADFFAVAERILCEEAMVEKRLDRKSPVYR